MSLLLGRPGPLRNPGRSPGFDLGHPAAAGIRFSGVAAGASFMPLISGYLFAPLAGGVLIGAPSANVIGILGPSTGFSGASDTIDFVSIGADSPTAFTVASIFQLTTINGSNQALLSSAGGSGSGIILYIDATGLLTIFGNNVGTSSGLTVAANVPYFAAYSQTASTGNVVLTRLDNGKTVTASVAAVIPIFADTDFYIGNDGFSQPLAGYEAAVMYSSAVLSAQQLLQWARDPWAFWYPSKFDLSMFLTTISGGAAPAAAPVGIVGMTASEW